MRKLLIYLVLSLLSMTAFSAPIKATTINQLSTAVPSLAPLSNTINWHLDKSGDMFELQNSDSPTVYINVKVSPQTNNKVSDPVIMGCKSSYTTLTPDVNYLCEIPYTNLMVMVAHPFVNGASGTYSVVGKNINVTQWQVNSASTKVILKNTTSSSFTVYYYSDEYMNNSSNVSDRVWVNCINKTFDLRAGNGRICNLPPGGTAQVQLSPQDFRNGSSGGFTIL